MDTKQTELTTSMSDQISDKKPRKFTFTLLAAVLALLIAVALTVTLFIYSHNLSFLLNTISNNNKLLHRQMQQLQGIQVTLLNRLNDQGQQLAKNQQLESGNQKAWILAEVNYLVRLANYNLSYGRDVPAAIALLQTADQRLAQLNAPALNQIRQQLANNITSLQAAGKLDMVGILAKISALQLQVKQLPLIAPPTFAAAATNKTTDSDKTQPVWRRAFDHSLATLKELVIVRHHQQPIEPLLDSEQFMYLHQNLQLQLQQAQWAVLHGQQDVYQNSLQQAADWVEKYFASASPQTTAFIQTINQLQKINIQPALPDMTALLNSLAQAERPAAAKDE